MLQHWIKDPSEIWHPQIEALASQVRAVGSNCHRSQIHGQRLQVGAILDWRAARSGKAAEDSGVTVWATDGFELMLLGQEVDFRHIQDLTAFCNAAWHSAEVLTALAADLGTVTYHFIWLLYHCLLYTSPSPRDRQKSRMPSSA